MQQNFQKIIGKIKQTKGEVSKLKSQSVS